MPFYSKTLWFLGLSIVLAWLYTQNLSFPYDMKFFACSLECRALDILEVIDNPLIIVPSLHQMNIMPNGAAGFGQILHLPNEWPRWTNCPNCIFVEVSMAKSIVEDMGLQVSLHILKMFGYKYDVSETAPGEEVRPSQLRNRVRNLVLKTLWVLLLRIGY